MCQNHKHTIGQIAGRPLLWTFYKHKNKYALDTAILWQNLFCLIHWQWPFDFSYGHQHDTRSQNLNYSNQNADNLQTVKCHTWTKDVNNEFPCEWKTTYATAASMTKDEWISIRRQELEKDYYNLLNRQGHMWLPMFSERCDIRKHIVFNRKQ